MKNRETEAPKKRHYGWSFDPTKSFLDGEEGEKHQTLIMMGPNDNPLKEPLLWQAGKRAFDILNSAQDKEKITNESIEDLFKNYPSDLIELFNSMKATFDKMIRDGLLAVSSESGDPVKEIPPITNDAKGFWTGYKIEPNIVMLDDICEQQCLQLGIDSFPYDRELLAAYYTLTHLDTTLMGVSYGEVGLGEYELVTYWFDKLDAYERTKRNIQIREKREKSQKSKSMNSQRHAKRNEAMQLVTDDWSKRKSEFRSAEKAGNYYADWLKSQGHPYEPRTITNWIRKYAKDNGIKLR